MQDSAPRRRDKNEPPGEIGTLLAAMAPSIQQRLPRREYRAPPAFFETVRGELNTDGGQLICVFEEWISFEDARSRFLETSTLPWVEPEVRTLHDIIAHDLDRMVRECMARGYLEDRIV